MSNPQQESGQSKRPLLERRTPLGVSFALVILFAFFFVLPFGFRSARLSLNKKENNIKDWLPSEFVETAELEWFADHFIGESFVIATWPGCNEDDQRLKLLESKLRHESSESDPAAGITDPALAEDYRAAREYGLRLGLLPASRKFDNWGGRNERWFATKDGKWYFITPDGRLHRWEEASNGPAGLLRNIKRSTGTYKLQGTFVAAFGRHADGTLPNPFHNDPSLLCAPMFRSVETGASLAKELSKEGGLLWPVDFTDQARRPLVARRRAMERLTGSLFAPAVPQEFAWTAEAFRQVIPASQRDEIPDDFEALVEATLTDFADEYLDGDRNRIASSITETQTEAWYAVFDAAGIKPPPRQTCLLITLTETAQDNLAYALGRGVLGGPRGRLLQLAEESGVQPASPPSMAPPPFNKSEVESIGGTPPLRLGGPPVDNIAIDEEGTVTLVRLVGYSVLVGALLSFLCFGSMKITIMVFIVGGSAAMLSMAFVNWTNGSVDAILMSMPSLVYVLGLSGSIHVVNYYRDEVRSGGRSGAAGRALRHALFPCSLAALTTAIGLGSLYTSNLAPISNFGLYSAIGVIATLAILFSYLPAALETFLTDPKSEPSSSTPQDDPNAESWLSDQWAAAGDWICRHHAFVTVACLIVLVSASFGLAKIKTSVQLLKLFDKNARIIRDYAWLESHFGKLVPMELVLRIPPSMQSKVVARVDGSAASESTVSDRDAEDAQEHLAMDAIPLNVLERVEAVARINSVIHQTLGEPGLDIVGSTMAVNTFLKPLPEVTNGWNAVRSQFVKQLNDGREELLGNDYLRLEKNGPYAGSELWRISLRVGALSDVDYGEFIETLRTSVEPVLRAYDVRDKLLEQLASDPGFPKKKRPVLVVMGAERPKSIQKTELVNRKVDADLSSEDRIDKRAIFLATLDELLRGERLPTAVWMNHQSKEKPIEIGGDLWDKIVSKSDAFIWVGEDKVPRAALASANLVVDAQAIFSKTIQHELIDGTIPEATGSGAMQVVYTGVVPVVYKAQRTLLHSLVQSIGLAFVLIAAVMIVLLNPARSPIEMLKPANAFTGFMAGMISMIPNVFPVLLVFGIMGHFGRLVDIGTMMTASVAMGVAVDDTIHFLSWFRSYLDRGYDRIKAIEMTYRRVGPAMTQTTIVGGLGLFVFALSTFTPTQRFGTLMLVLLTAALVGDLVLLPALLAGPLGRFFKPRDGSNPDPGNLDKDASLADPEKETESGQEPVFDKESLPQLRVHAPSRRADQSHRMKRR